jgi:hypothetical protein
MPIGFLLVRENRKSRTALYRQGGSASRVLSEIVKRRSFRANVKRLRPSNVLRAPNVHAWLTGFGWEESVIMSAKLDRLVVGSILKQERSFLSVPIDANLNSYRPLDVS